MISATLVLCMGRGSTATPGSALPATGAPLDLGGAQFSVINALRTGNVLVDMLIAMTVPLLFKLLFSDSRAWLARLHAWLFGDAPPKLSECVRLISYISVGSSLAGREHKNQVLQKAITLYLTDVVAARFDRKAQVALTAMHDTSVGFGPTDKFNPFARYRLTWQAPENEWVEVEEGLQFQQRAAKDGTERDDNDYGSRPIEREMIIFELRCAAAEGPAKIDAFIEKALAWYKGAWLVGGTARTRSFTRVRVSPTPPSRRAAEAAR